MWDQYALEIKTEDRLRLFKLIKCYECLNLQQGFEGGVMPREGGRSRDRDRWGDIYANMPVKKMVALYDYDPQELSPNVDAEVSCGP